MRNGSLGDIHLEWAAGGARMADETRLPADIDAQPVVQAAAALRPVLRDYHDELEREQRLPRALVDEMRAAGCGSVGWNIANNSIGQLVTLGLPEEGTREIHGQGPATMAGTAVQGGGQAVPVDGGYRVSGRWQFGSGCQESSWMLGSFQVIGDDGQPRRHPDGGS